MKSPTLTSREQLDAAGHFLRQVLLRIDYYAKSRVSSLDLNSKYAESTMAHVRDLDALIGAVQQYDSAVTVCLTEPTPTPNQLNPNLTSAEVLAIREADPVYRLGFVRGYKRGQAQGQLPAEKALSLYAQHASLPEPTSMSTPASECDALIRRVRSFLAELTQRYGIGSISRHHSATRQYGNV